MEGAQPPDGWVESATSRSTHEELVEPRWLPHSGTEDYSAHPYVYVEEFTE